MVKSIYFLKPAWCGIHSAGLWPEQGLQPVIRATAFRRWFSLLSWVNEGSHSVPDDIYMALDTGTTAKYLEIFRQVFVKLGQKNHYNMMMGNTHVAISAVVQ